MKVIYIIAFLFVGNLLPAQKIIVIDPGHNYEDIVSEHKTQLEVETNMAVARELSDMIKYNNSIDWIVKLTRENSNPTTNVTHSERVEMANSLESTNQGQVRFLSIHCNAGDGTGVETFYCTEGEESENTLLEFATNIHDNKVHYGKWHDRLRITEDESYPGIGYHLYVLRNLDMPGCLSELGFVTTPEDSEKLESYPWRRRFAYAYYQGLTAAISSLEASTISIVKFPDYENNDYSCELSVNINNNSNHDFYGYIRPVLNDFPMYNIDVDFSQFATLGEELVYIPAEGSYNGNFVEDIPFTAAIGKMLKLECKAYNTNEWYEFPKPDLNEIFSIPINSIKVNGTIYDQTMNPISGMELFGYQRPTLKSFDPEIWNDNNLYDPTIDFSDDNGNYSLLIPKEWDEAVVSVRSDPSYDEKLVYTTGNSALSHYYTTNPTIIGIGSGSADCSSYPGADPNYPRQLFSYAFEEFNSFKLNNTVEPHFACLNGALIVGVDPVSKSEIHLAHCGAVPASEVICYIDLLDIKLWNEYLGRDSNPKYEHYYTLGLAKCNSSFVPIDDEIVQDFSFSNNNHSEYLGQLDLSYSLNSMGIQAHKHYKLRIGTRAFECEFEENNVTLNVFTGIDNVTIDSYPNLKSFYAASNNVDIAVGLIDLPCEIVAGNSITIHPNNLIESEFKASINTSIAGSCE